MLARTGSHGSGVGGMVPVIIRMVLCNCVSTSLECEHLHQTGLQYYTTE